MTLRFLIRSAALLTLFAAVAGAQTSVTTDPVGFASVNCPSNSDTFASIPFTRPPEFVGSLQTVSTDTLSVSGSPWAANQFVYAAGTQPKTYYVILGKASTVNPKEGSSYLVTANGTNTLTINLQGDNLSTVPAGTQITVIPYATLASVFPAGDANVSFVPSPSLFSRQTEILIPSYGASGTNLAAAATYFFFNGAWRKFGTDSTQDHGDDPLANNGYVIIRNAGTASKLTANGAVSLRKETVQIVSRSATQQDNFVSVTRPVNVALNDLGLISSGAFASSPSLIASQVEPQMRQTRK